MIPLLAALGSAMGGAAGAGALGTAAGSGLLGSAMGDAAGSALGSALGNGLLDQGIGLGQAPDIIGNQGTFEDWFDQNTVLGQQGESPEMTRSRSMALQGYGPQGGQYRAPGNMGNQHQIRFNYGGR